MTFKILIWTYLRYYFERSNIDQLLYEVKKDIWEKSMKDSCFGAEYGI